MEVLTIYEYCEQKGIQAFIKYTAWNGEKTGRNPATYEYIDTQTIRCLGGRVEKEYSVPRAVIPRRTMLSSWSKAALNVTLRAIANAS